MPASQSRWLGRAVNEQTSERMNVDLQPVAPRGGEGSRKKESQKRVEGGRASGHCWPHTAEAWRLIRRLLRAGLTWRTRESRIRRKGICWARSEGGGVDECLGWEALATSWRSEIEGGERRERSPNDADEASFSSPLERGGRLGGTSEPTAGAPRGDTPASSCLPSRAMQQTITPSGRGDPRSSVYSLAPTPLPFFFPFY